MQTMFVLASTSPDMPLESSDAEKKVAAAKVSQITEQMGESESHKVNLREICSDATNSVITLLKKINTPKE